jgi:hypothetical protein
MKKIIPVILLFLLSVTIHSQITCHGKVVDGDNGTPVPYATILILATNNGCFTSENGNFNIKVNSGVLF